MHPCNCWISATFDFYYNVKVHFNVQTQLFSIAFSYSTVTINSKNPKPVIMSSLAENCTA